MAMERPASVASAQSSAARGRDWIAGWLQRLDKPRSEFGVGKHLGGGLPLPH